MVNIHNIMEEQVLARINNLYEQVKEKGCSWLSCDCENCRLDTASYVLNRIPPRYVVSGRGVAHNADIISDSQLAADIDRIGIEGMRLVSTAKRPYHKAPALNGGARTPGLSHPVFNFPTFIGNIFDGSSFEPIIGATITLKLGNDVAPMMDPSWSNPSKTFAATNGSYTFWVKPVVADEEKQSKEFHFSVEVEAPNYSPAVYSFSIPIISEAIDRRELNSTYSLKIQDLFLFRSDISNDMEWNSLE